MPRVREYGIVVGEMMPGALNAITDVAGVRVGQVTLNWGEGPLVVGQGPVRTGVTVILPHAGDLYRHKVRAAVHTLNGFGKACGFEEVRERGLMETPIALTNTLNVWRVADGLVSHMLAQNPAIGIHTGTVNPVVGETNDGYLNDIQGRHVQERHVHMALNQAHLSGDFAPVAEGCVGAGTGTSAFGWKAGMGTASRVIPLPPTPGQDEPDAWTLGALVQANFGRPEQLTINGDPVGKRLRPPESQPQPEQGSILIVLATDAPLSSRQLARISRRAGVGMARTGSHLGHGSGDFVIAFTTANPVPHWPRQAVAPVTSLVDEAGQIDGLFQAAAEAVEEAILNALSSAVTTTGRDGHVRHALPFPI